MLTAALLFLGDRRDLPSLILQTDYIEFYTAGHMSRTGNYQRLYMSTSCQQMDDRDQRNYASGLPELDPVACAQKAIVFAYPPAVSFVFAPLSLLPFRTALIAWQLLSLACLACACLAFIRLQADGSPRPALNLFLSAFTLLSVVQTLVIGQTSLVFVLLPWVALYYFLARQRPLAAGLALAALSLKPQLCVPAVLMMAVLLFSDFRRRRQPDGGAWHATLRTAVTAVVAAAALHLLPFLLPGNLPFAWLHEVELLTRHIYGSNQYLYAYWDLGSLSSVLAMDLPVMWRAAWRLPLTAISLLFTLVQVLVLFRIAQSAHLSRQQRLDCLTVTSISFLPATALYLSNYDYAVFLLPAWIILALRRSLPVRALVTALVAVLIGIDACWLMVPFAVGHGVAQAAVTLLQIVLLAACTVTTICQLKLAGQPAPVQSSR